MPTQEVTHGYLPCYLHAEKLVRAGSRRWKKSETWLFYLCISPWLIGFLIWTAGPMVYSLYLSLTSWDLFTTPAMGRPDNYKDIFTDNPDFWQSMKVTAIYTFVSVPLSLVGALAIGFAFELEGARYRLLPYDLLSPLGAACVSRWRCSGSGCSIPLSAS